MGLFNRKRGDAPTGEAPTLTEAEAVAGIAVCAMYADGVISAEEDADLAAHLGKMKLFRRMSERELRGMFQKLHAVSAAGGDHALLDLACASLASDRLRPTAFLVAADLVLGDEEVGDAEEAFLEDLRARLRVEPATAQKILDVLAIKHAG